MILHAPDRVQKTCGERAEGGKSTQASAISPIIFHVRLNHRWDTDCSLHRVSDSKRAANIA
jgi:hypothetical protein